MGDGGSPNVTNMTNMTNMTQEQNDDTLVTTTMDLERQIVKYLPLISSSVCVAVMLLVLGCLMCPCGRYIEPVVTAEQLLAFHEASDKKRREAAATNIQKVYRGHSQRLQNNNVGKNNKKVREDAATNIQKVYRGHSQRLQKKNVDKDNKKGREKAATNIQHAYRQQAQRLQQKNVKKGEQAGLEKRNMGSPGPVVQEKLAAGAKNNGERAVLKKKMMKSAVDIGKSAASAKKGGKQAGPRPEVQEKSAAIAKNHGNRAVMKNILRNSMEISSPIVIGTSAANAKTRGEQAGLESALERERENPSPIVIGKSAAHAKDRGEEADPAKRLAISLPAPVPGKSNAQPQGACKKQAKRKPKAVAKNAACKKDQQEKAMEKKPDEKKALGKSLVGLTTEERAAVQIQRALKEGANAKAQKPKAETTQTARVKKAVK